MAPPHMKYEVSNVPNKTLIRTDTVYYLWNLFRISTTNSKRRCCNASAPAPRPIKFGTLSVISLIT